MQDKALDAMAKRYKEEMMRLYCRKPAETAKPAPESKPVTLPETSEEIAVLTENNSAAPSAQTAPPVQTAPPTVQISPPKPPAELLKIEREISAEYREKLMHPPMPEIPQSAYEKQSSLSAGNHKFPPADDIIAELPKFDNGHGNYEFTENSGGEDDPEYQKEMAELDGKNNAGTGFLQMEISCEKGSPIDCALAVVTLNDILIVTLFSGSDGTTEAIELPVPHDGEKYTVTVYKEEFFTVHSLEVPVFSGIKSIQPVTMRADKE